MHTHMSRAIVMQLVATTGLVVDVEDCHVFVDSSTDEEPVFNQSKLVNHTTLKKEDRFNDALCRVEEHNHSNRQ